MRIYEFTTTTISLYNYNFESAKRNTSNAILQMGNFLFFLHLILIEEYFMVFVVNSFCLCFDWRHFLESKKKKMEENWPTNTKIKILCFMNGLIFYSIFLVFFFCFWYFNVYLRFNLFTLWFYCLVASLIPQLF